MNNHARPDSTYRSNARPRSGNFGNFQEIPDSTYASRQGNGLRNFLNVCLFEGKTMIAEIRRQQKETVEACLKRTMNIVIDGFFDEGLADVKITRVNVDVGNDSQVMNVTLFFEKKKQCVTECVEDLEKNSLTKTNV